MKQKMTVLSLASMLLITPVHSVFAQPSDYSSVSAAESETSSASTTDTSSQTSSSHSGSDTGASSAPTADTASQTGSSATQSETNTNAASTTEGSANNPSSDTQSETGSSISSTNDSSSPSRSSKTRSEDRTNAAPATSNGSASSESRLGDVKNNLDFNLTDLTDKSFDLNFDEVMNLSSGVGELVSKADPAAYARYLEEEQAVIDLFTLKENNRSTINEFKQSLAANPNNNNLYVELAIAYLASGDLNNAEAIAKQLDVKAPESYLSLILQAELAGSQGKSEEKQLYLEQAVEKHPASAIARFKLGEELTKAGKPGEAIAQLTTAAALNPKNPSVFEELNKAFAQTNNTVLKTFVNGVVPKFEVKPFIENGSTLVPARAIAEALGANVEWNEATRQVTIQRGETTIQLTNESNAAFVNGQEVTIDAPARIVNGSTVLPLRFVGESLGAKIDWKPESQLIVISG